MFKFLSKTDWMFYHSLFILFAYSVDIMMQYVLCTPIAGLALFIALINKNFKEYTSLRPLIGFPNLVTTLRLILLFIAPFLQSNFALFILSLVVVCLDGFDGFLARKLNQITTFGGQLDMETDAFFCLLFSLIIYVQNPSLFWVLLAGSLRYVYKIVTTCIENKSYTPTGKKYSTFFAGLYFLSFVGFYYFENKFQILILILGNCLVIFSFIVSFYEYYFLKNE